MAIRITAIDYSADPASRLSDEARKPWFVFLDSCCGRANGGRYDIVSSEPVTTLRTFGEVTEIVTGETIERSRVDPFTLVKEALAQYPTNRGELPFVGGAIGYFAYDLARRLERLPTSAARDIDIPDMAIGIYDWAAVFDHQQRRAWLVSDDSSKQNLSYWENLLTTQEPVTPPAYATSFQTTSVVEPDINFTQYAQGFARIKRYITDGDCYQVNLAQRFSARVTGDSWDAYRRLRSLNPAPYSAFLAQPDCAILSSSPERFLKTEQRLVETKPIKGTRPRAKDPIRDRELARELAASEKDRAENLMIVDLLRNDLGKTCAIGSVEVPELFAIESFATVHHLVSTVRGILPAGLHASDLLRGCFPGGSITGAPKLRAMEIIEELEPCRRTIYCGAIGYISFDGNMDTNITIRTLVHHNDTMYCWAGGGIVADSDVNAEYRESLDKAAAMLDVFLHAEAQHLDH